MTSAPLLERLALGKAHGDIDGTLVKNVDRWRTAKKDYRFFVRQTCDRDSEYYPKD